MGAKQSKRSVDISGKEAEGAGEVAGAGGEGRLEQLADADTLKPQLNGDAHHIHAPDHTDKEKQLDNGIPENEKDATTEKEHKEKENETEKATTPLTNGDSESAAPAEPANGDNAPAADQEATKKPKKEKVKKKWSIRSISFSRKDKPKQDKKQKEEEPKTNGEPQKVPEEASENNTVEVEAIKTPEETKKITENGDEKTPETPVTEPLTNGSSVPETPKTETPENENSAAATPDSDIQKEEPKVEPAPEPLTVNGISPKDSKDEISAVTEEKSEKVKNEEVPAVAPAVAVTESSVEKEVCVEQMPLIEPTPPPLPVNPPPSSVASFAETTMASHMEQTSLTDPTTLAVQPPALTTYTAAVEPACIDQLTNESTSLNSAPVPTNSHEHPPAESIVNDVESTRFKDNESEEKIEDTINTINNQVSIETPVVQVLINAVVDSLNESDVNTPSDLATNDNNCTAGINLNGVALNNETVDSATITTVNLIDSVGAVKDMGHVTEEITGVVTTVTKTEPAIPLDNDVITEIGEYAPKTNSVISSGEENVTPQDDVEHNNFINKNLSDDKNNAQDINTVNNTVECNGKIEVTKLAADLLLESEAMESLKIATTSDDSAPASIAEVPPADDAPAEHRDDRRDSNEGSESFPAPPSDLDSEPSAASPEPQELLLVSDKMAELSEKMTPETIAEITSAVEAVTLQETSTDVAVAK